MAVTTVYSQIDLSDNTLKSIDLNGIHNFYLISVANDDSVSSVTFEMYIDSGVQNTPLVIQYLTLPVKNGIVGQRYCGVPDKFYLKPTQVILKNGDVKKENIGGTPYSVEINMNPIDLG